MKRLSSAFIFTGIVLIAVSVNIIFFTFYPVVFTQLKYLFSKTKDVRVVGQTEKTSAKNVIRPIDENFGIVIPKIGANAKVIANVDPYNEKIYQLALTRGVAHARGSSFPDRDGNVFIFSHSSVDFYEAVHYNSIFYLLSKMQKGDEVYLFYKKEKYQYRVVDKKIAGPGEVSYLTGSGDVKTLTLMTCWPPGTTFKRLLVIAQAVD